MTRELVADDAGLAAIANALEPATAFALDLEGNSFHAYRDRVCLIQIAIGSGAAEPTIFLVDPLAVDPRPLGPAFADPRRTAVVHGGDYDVRSLRRDFDLGFGRVFDTMLAAQTLRLPGLGLAALLHSELGIDIRKGEQRSDWGRRPLSDEQLSYAKEDVRHLLPLMERLKSKLIDAGQLAAADAQFERLRVLRPREKLFDLEGWRRLKGASALDEAQKRILRELWLARDRVCRELDRAPFKLVGEQTMVEIAKRRPADLEALRAIPGVGSLLVRRLGSEIIAAAQSG